jgi:hypothetical protein
MFSEKKCNCCTFGNAAVSAFVPPVSATFGLCRAFSSQHKENVAMAKKEAKKLDELFHDTLKDIYFAEKKILSTLPKMEKAAQAPSSKGPSPSTKQRRRSTSLGSKRFSRRSTRSRKPRPAMRLSVLPTKAR